MPICIFVIDLTPTPPIVLEANRRAELVHGYTAAELVGMPATQLVPEDARLAVLAIVQQVQQGHMVRPRPPTSAGTARAFLCASSPRPIRPTPAA